MDHAKAGIMSEPIIQCRDVSHSYSGKLALKQVSFEIFAGEPIGLVGPNGAGKTTLLSVLCGFLKPSAGIVSIFGYKPGDSNLCGKISALPQDARFDPVFTIGEQLAFLACLQGFDVEQAWQEAGRVLDAVALKESLHSILDTLSHGMAKRVAIAQALIGSPELILLDEPTAGLDPVNTRNIRSIIMEQAKHSTFVISSHDLAELGRVCQKVLLLENGVMSPMQHNVAEADGNTGFFTLQMETCPADKLIKELNQLNGVIKVSNPQKNEFLVEYLPEQAPQIDIEILTCLAKHHWSYRQLIRGKSLEEKLFFSH